MYPVIPASKSFLVMNFDIDTISHLPMELQRICTYMLTYYIGHGNNAAHTLGYLISVSVVWAILSVSDAKISTCTVSVSMWKRL